MSQIIPPNRASTYHPDKSNVPCFLLDKSNVPCFLLTIEEKYRNVTLELDDDSFLTGLILSEDNDSVTLQTGPNGAQLQTIAKSVINSRRPSKISIMPESLLNSRDKEQILDLLAYLLSNGNADHSAFKHAH